MMGRREKMFFVGGRVWLARVGYDGRVWGLHPPTAGSEASY